MIAPDPEREAIGRSITALLMAKRIRAGGRLHVPTLLTEIGALAGFATQLSLRKSVIEAEELEPDSVLAEVVAKSGEVFYFGELLNQVLFEGTAKSSYSIWTYVSGAVPETERGALPDLDEIISRAARTVGSATFGVPHLPAALMPHVLPRDAVRTHWALVQGEFTANKRDPAEWPYDLALAAQRQMLVAKDAVALPMAARIVMEAAIPMSKIDPHTVPGACRS